MAEIDRAAGEIVPAAVETDREAGETDREGAVIVPAAAGIDREEVSAAAEHPLWGLAAEMAAGRLLTERLPTKTQTSLDNRAGLAFKKVVLPAVTAYSPEAATSGFKKADRAAVPTLNREPAELEIPELQGAEPDSPALEEPLGAELRAQADRFSKLLPI